MAGPVGFQKGHPGYKLKGTKNRDTILKEERRAIFDAEASKIFLEKIKEAKPEYILDQFLGKAGEKLDITTGGEKFDVDIKLLAEKMAKEIREDYDKEKE